MAPKFALYAADRSKIRDLEATETKPGVWEFAAPIQAGEGRFVGMLLQTNSRLRLIDIPPSGATEVRDV